LAFGGEALKDDRVGSLAVELDLAIRSTDDGRHAFASTVELEDVEDLVLLLLAEDLDEDGLRLAGLLGPRKEVSKTGE
jgi:hypothetical protein